MLTRLASDNDHSVRRMVAEHWNCPQTLLERLAGDTDNEVRRAVAQHSRCSEAALERLAGFNDNETRRFAMLRQAALTDPAAPSVTADTATG